MTSRATNNIDDAVRWFRDGEAIAMLRLLGLDRTADMVLVLVRAVETPADEELVREALIDILGGDALTDPDIVDLALRIVRGEERVAGADRLWARDLLCYIRGARRTPRDHPF